MSRKISDALEILSGLAQFRGSDKSEFRRVRISVVRAIAKSRSVDHHTVSDVYIRRLGPHVTSTAAFDNLVLDWLNGSSPELQRILEVHAESQDDAERVRMFFKRGRL